MSFAGGEGVNLAIRERVLPCGLVAVMHHDDASPLVTTSVMYRVGSSDERADRTGFAHLFEHLFKSSQARLGGLHHYDVLKRAGASEANASTSADRTAYHETLPANRLDLALWIESNRMALFWPDLDEQRLVTQQQVVRAERRQRYEDVPYGAERFALALALYPDGHPLRHLTIGLHDHIAAATMDDVRAFYRTWYVPANATLVIAGNLGDDPAAVDALVDRYFDLPASVRPARPEPVLAPLAETRRETLRDPFAALTRVHRVWRAPATFAAGEAELDLLASGWAAAGTGALWRRLVYDTQLAQRASAWHAGNRLAGEFHISVDLRSGTSPDDIATILDDELAGVLAADDAALQALIDRALTRREAGMLWGLVRVSARAQAMQRYLLHGDTADGFAADLARYRAVTPTSLRAVATAVLTAPFIEVTSLGHGGAERSAPTDPAGD